MLGSERANLIGIHLLSSVLIPIKAKQNVANRKFSGESADRTLARAFSVRITLLRSRYDVMISRLV